MSENTKDTRIKSEIRIAFANGIKLTTSFSMYTRFHWHHAYDENINILYTQYLYKKCFYPIIFEFFVMEKKTRHENTNNSKYQRNYGNNNRMSNHMCNIYSRLELFIVVSVTVGVVYSKKQIITCVYIFSTKKTSTFANKNIMFSS